MGLLSRRMTGIPRIVWLITLLHLCLLLFYTSLFPLYRAPDEHVHVDLILQVRQGSGYPQYDRALLSAQVFESRRLMLGAGGSRGLTVEEGTPRGERPSFSEIAPPGPLPDGPGLQVANHPPLYYTLMAATSSLVTSLVPASFWSWDRVVMLLRLLNVLLVAGLPLLAYATASRMGWRREVVIGAALFPLAIPQLTHIGSTVNNDNLMILLGGLLTLLLARIVTGDVSRRTALMAGTLAGAGMLAKGFALTMPVWILGAYLVVGFHHSTRGLVALRTAQSLLVAMGLGGWWWVRNQILFGKVQTSLGLRPPAAEGYEHDFVWWIGRYLSWLRDRWWGSFGRVDVDLPHALMVVATLVVFVAVGVAIVRGAPPRTRRQVMLLLFPVLALAVMVTVGAMRAYIRTGQAVGFHGRYLFPGVVGLSAVVAVGIRRALGRGHAWLPLGMAVVACVMQLVAVKVILSWFWGPVEPTAFPERIQAMFLWSTWSPILLSLFVVLAIASGAWLVAQLLRYRGPNVPSQPHDSAVKSAEAGGTGG